MLAASSRSAGLPSIRQAATTTVSAASTTLPDSRHFAIAAPALSRATRSAYACGSSASVGVSSTSAGTTSNEKPADARSSARRGEAEARIRRIWLIISGSAMIPLHAFGASLLADVVRRQPASQQRTDFAWQLAVGPALARVTTV